MHHSSFGCLRKPLQKHDHKAITFPLTQQRKLDCCWRFFCSHLKEKEGNQNWYSEKTFHTVRDRMFPEKESSSACRATLKEIRMFKSLMVKEKFNCRILSSFTGNQEKWSKPHYISISWYIFLVWYTYKRTEQLNH